MYLIIHIKLIFCRCEILSQDCDKIGGQIEHEGDYDEAQRLTDNNGNLTSETRDSIERLNQISKDLDLIINLSL